MLSIKLKFTKKNCYQKKVMNKKSLFDVEIVGNIKFMRVASSNVCNNKTENGEKQQILNQMFCVGTNHNCSQKISTNLFGIRVRR